MAKINNISAYAEATPTNNTILLGSESAGGDTKNYKISDLSQFLNVNPTLATLTVTGQSTFQDTAIFSNANSISAAGIISTATNVVALGTIAGGLLYADPSNAPATSSDTGAAGTIVSDADYIYVCTATDTWKRAALSTW